MNHIFFVNRGSEDARIKLISEDGAPIETNSAGAIFAKDNDLGFCISAVNALPDLTIAEDSGIIKLHGRFTFEFDGLDVLEIEYNMRPSHIVNASQFDQYVKTELSDYFQVEIPESEPAGDEETGIPYSYILKPKLRDCKLSIFRLDKDSTIESTLVDHGVSGAWIDPDIQNGAILYFGVP